MRKHHFFLLFVLLPLLLIAIQPTHAAATITVSGTITGPGGPVPNVTIGLGSPLDYEQVQTNSAGQYSVSVPTEGDLWVNVRPALATRLAQVNRHYTNVNSSFTLDLTLVSGHLLSLRPTAGGQPVLPDHVWGELLAMTAPGEGGYQLEWDDSAQRFQRFYPLIFTAGVPIMSPRAILRPSNHLTCARPTSRLIFRSTPATNLLIPLSHPT